VSATYERTLPNDVRALGEAARDVRATLARAGVDEETVYAADLALEELVGNTIRYGYPEGGEHSIRVELRVEGEEVHLTIEDDARPFDPTAQPEPPRSASLANASRGGRGIPMVRRMVGDMRYQRTRDGNRLALVLPRKRKA